MTYREITGTDAEGRVWSFCPFEGTWGHGPHLIGCGNANGRKWSIWAGPNKGWQEFKTLKEAMGVCEEKVSGHVITTREES
tara:strand:+ start:6050 stop:6292 length:243 start_codon:yes stop_codon:yes gene_type:complete